MKRLLINLLLFGLAGGATAEPLEARIKISGYNTLSGTLEKRTPGFVTFRSKRAPSAGRIADSQITRITFKIDEDTTALKRQFDQGAYREVSDTYNQILPKFLPYFGLPSNLTDEFTRWMIASYWVDEYTRTIGLAETLMRMPDSPLHESAEFYTRLAQMDQGNYAGMTAFMETDEAATLYPENSAVRFYIQARLLQHEARPLEAIRTITGLVARHSHNADWMPKAELLCAELYFELDLPESAQAVLADIRDFYSDEDIQKKAAALAAKQ